MSNFWGVVTDDHAFRGFYAPVRGLSERRNPKKSGTMGLSNFEDNAIRLSISLPRLPTRSLSCRLLF